MKKRETTKFTGNRRRISYTVQYLYDDKGTRYEKIIEERFIHEATFNDIYMPARKKERILDCLIVICTLIALSFIVTGMLVYPK